MANDQRCQMQGKGFSCPGAPLSLSRGTLAGAARDLVAHHVVGLPRGQRQAAELGARVGARVLRCGTGQNKPVTDQDLRWSEAWLGNHWHLAGVIRAVVPGLPSQAYRCGPGRGEHLAGPQHGARGRVVCQPP
jgi:hypothetical protein